jgi:ribosomal protein L11 methyltransferase
VDSEQDTTAAWIQVRFTADKSRAEPLEDALLQAGALAVTLEDAADQPLLEPGVGEIPLWQNLVVVGLFPASTDTGAVLSELTSQWKDGELPPHRVELIEDKDWEREWMKHYEPMRFGQRLWVCPSWKQQPDPDATNLMLDPGLAFGTGTHPTTALCLEWLDAGTLPGQTVIDYGCGSGILGIAALLLGAEHLVAVDNDPQALEATLENARRNKIDPGAITVLHPDEVNDATPAADVLVANILAGPLLDLAPNIARLVKKGGHLLLSGILEDQADLLASRYGQWFIIDPPTFQKEWVRLNGIRR